MHARSLPMAVIVAVGLIPIFSVLRMSDGALVSLFPDDAYFYLKTAWNLASGKGMTFDGINPTNGFHYGFLALLTGMFTLLPAGQTALLLKAALLLQLAMFGMFFVTVVRSWPELRSPAGLALVACTVALVPLVFIPTMGMESSLVLLAAALYARVLTEPDFLRSRVALLGAGALVVLARHDLLLLLLVMPAFVPRADRARALTCLCGGVLTTALLSAYNMWFFGHAATISSSLKFHPLAFRAERPWVVEFGTLRILRYLAPIPISFVLSWLSYRWARAEPSKLDRLLLGLNSHALIYALALLAFATGANHPWYYALTTSVGVYTALRAARWLPRKLHIAGSWCAVLIAMLLSVRTVARFPPVTELDAMLQQITALRRYVASDAPVFMIDQSGRVGFWSDLRVVNGDGLVNSWRYQDAIHTNTLPRYFAECGIRWIMTDTLSSVARQGRVTVTVPGWRGSLFEGGRELGSAPLSAAVTSLFPGYWLLPVSAFEFKR